AYHIEYFASYYRKTSLKNMSRLEKIKEQFKDLKIDSFLVKNLANIRYISGFSGSAASVLLTKDDDYFISDFRYKTQSSKEVKENFEIIIYVQNSLLFLKDLIEKHDLKRIGFESNFMTYNDVLGLREQFKGTEFVPVDSLIEKIVMVKNDKEIADTRKAVEITDRTFSELLKFIKPGLTEREVSAQISYMQKHFGADGDSFDAIVASGERSAFPHARPTDRKISNGDLLTLDFGCTVNGMKSDMTRTLAIGDISEECMNIYSIVKEAQLKALHEVKAGMNTKVIDAVARNYIKENGYGDNFGHGLGHGVGYDIHEKPALNERTEYILEVNNIITIEPGIYVEGVGGVRIEDDVIVTEEGCEILNKSSKELITL
ncbi:MAG: aminopeptidase P family protein, partial [Ignavibacteriae bacterium]|nr:aminopeptidase P family protein [Ignavibacteriota bacterium]